MKQKTIYLVRHGECRGNKDNCMRGRIDFPLNENGIAQARAIADELAGKGIRRIYTSPLIRAAETAAAIAEKTGAPVETCKGFTNISLGIWDGRKKSELAMEYPEQWQTWLTDAENLRIEGGETVDSVRERSVAALTEIVKSREEDVIAVISHRGVLKPLIAGLLRIEKPYLWRLQVDNASYSTVAFREDRGFTLVNLNRTEHLKHLPLVEELD